MVTVFDLLFSLFIILFGKLTVTMDMYIPNTQANMMFQSAMPQTPNGLSCPAMEPSYSQGSESSIQSSFTYPDLCSSSQTQELDFLPCQSPFESFYDCDFVSSPSQTQYAFPDLYPAANSSYANAIPIPRPAYYDPSLATSASSISSSPPVQWPAHDDTVFPGFYQDVPLDTSPKPNKPFPCTDCGKAFTRSADLKRHQTSVHYPVFQDCPMPDCARKGGNGFPRKDHLLEHLRAYHHVPVPKRGALKRVAKARCL